ncbi:nucleolar protein 9 [Thrips palmi]|uniref:Nucleolar protein 9 n=1 Tax=Thrips palmi TaxID=161013 RepID=A0A6P8Y1J6_THRPL|nr:nucleolar protein 9 [Thrips palmi]
MAAPEEQRRHGWPKKRKSFLQNAKGMGRKGQFGHGMQMDQDTYDYFVRILERLNGEFDSPEEKESLVTNALATTEGNELDYCRNQIGSRVIEALIKCAPPSSLIQYMEVFSSHLRIAATDRFAGHVFETLIATVAKFGRSNGEDNSSAIESDEDQAKQLTADAANKWVLKVGKFLLNNLEEFIWDEYANYPIRTILMSLAGLPPSDSNSNSNRSQSRNGPKKSVPANFSSSLMKTEDDAEVVEDVVLPDGFKELLKEYFKHISSMSQFEDLAYSNGTSALLQTLLKALSKNNPKLKKRLLKQLIDQVFSKKTLEESTEDKKDFESSTAAVPPVFTTDASVRLLESALEQASSKYVTQIYANCFMGRIFDLACDLATNFAVQRLLACMGDPSEFENIFDELAPGMNKIIASGKTGVLLALCQVCKRLSVKQAEFIRHLMNALNCYEPADRRSMFVPLALRLCTYEDYKQKDETTATAIGKDGVKKSFINLHGSIIVQTLLTYKKPISIVNSVLEMPTSELKSLACDLRGSYVITAFVESEFVGEKSRERLLHRFRGSYVEMACSKKGSYALECIYKKASLGNQMKILEELSHRESLIMATDPGKILANKFSLDLFRHRRNEWKQMQTRQDRTKELFADIIGPSTS